MRLLIIILVFSTSVYGQNEYPCFSANIMVEIAADEYNDQANSFIKRELRNLGDLTIVTEDSSAKYVLSVIIVEDKLEGGSRIGFAASAAITDVLDMQFLQGFGLDSSAFSDGYFGRYHRYFHTHWVQVGPDLKELCQRLVAHFDSSCLDPARELDRRLFEAKRKFMEKALNDKPPE